MRMISMPRCSSALIHVVFTLRSNSRCSTMTFNRNFGLKASLRTRYHPCITSKFTTASVRAQNNHGQAIPFGSDTISAAALDVIQQAGDTEMKRSDYAGYSPVQQPSVCVEHLWPPLAVVRSQAPTDQDARPSTGPEAEN